MRSLQPAITGALALVAVVALSCERGEEEEEWSPSWPCTDYYLDEDGDGWGVDVTTCDWDVPDGYAARVGDCCDSDPHVHPFAEFSGAPHECPILQWDFDCDGAVEADFPDTGLFTSCGEFCNGPGWAGTVPACGENGTFMGCTFSSDRPSDYDGHGWPFDPPGTDPLPPPPCTLTCFSHVNWAGPRGCR